MRKIFLDLDGVIINLVDGIIKHFNMDCTAEDVNTWDYFTLKTVKLHQEFWAGLSDEFWVNLEKYPWADKVLAMVEPYRPCLLTSPAYNNGTARQKWIQNNLPEYYHEGRYLIGPAKHYVAREDCILIDDFDGNIDEWKKEGGIGILFPQYWNKNARFADDPVGYLEIKLSQYLGG